MPDKQEMNKRIHDILRERGLIPVGMQLGTVELMQFRAVLEGMADKLDSPDMREKIGVILMDFAEEIGGTRVQLRPSKDKIEALYAPVIEQAVKAEHDRMIKYCVDEGNDAYKRGVDKERERVLAILGDSARLTAEKFREKYGRSLAITIKEGTP